MAATLVYSTATVELWVDWATGAGYAYCWPVAGGDLSYGDGYIWGSSTTYSTARSTSSAANVIATNFYAGQDKSGSTYLPYRAVLPFDTTFLGAGTTVTSATLTVTPYQDSSTTDFDIIVRKITPTLPWQSTNREATYDAILSASSILTLANTSSISINTPVTSANIGSANVVKNAWTFLSLISSRDIANTTPGGAEYVIFHSVDNATAAYRPYLTVNFTGLTGVGNVYVAQAAVEVPYTATTVAKIQVAQAAVEVPYTSTTTAKIQVAQAAVEVPQTLNVPTISTVTPYIGGIGDSVTITGDYFHTVQGTGTVTVGGVSATVTSWSNTSITITIPNCAAGNNNIIVTNAYSYASAAATFRNANGTVDFPADSGSYGRILGTNATYATARSTSSSTTATPTVGQGTGYNVYRSFFRYDTSALGTAGTITNATNSLSVSADNSATDFDVDIIKAAWTSTLTANREANYDLALSATKDVTWRNTSGLAQDTLYTSPSLDTTYISRTGYTYYAYRSARDATATTPTGNELIQFRTPSDSASLRPRLTLTYTDNGPVITDVQPNPNGQGNEVTITGTGFGASQGNGYVTFTSSGNETTVTSWSATEIVLDIPLAASSGNISVTDNGGLRSAGYYLQLEIPIDITDTLGLTETVGISTSTSLTDNLALTDSIGDISGDLTPDDTITMAEEIDIGVTVDRADTLALTDTLLIEVTPELQTDSLELTDAIDVMRYIMITDDLVMDAGVEGGEGTITLPQVFPGEIGYLWGKNANYSQARSNAFDFEYPAQLSWVGQDKVAGTTYWIWRTILKFDTSGLFALLMSGWEIQDAAISMYLGSYDVTVPVTINIGSADWEVYDPPTLANQTDLYNTAGNSGTDAPWKYFDGSAMTLQYYDSDPLDTFYINPIGYTYYSVVSAEDLIGSPPNSYEAVSIENLDGATPPLLKVTLFKSGGEVEGDDQIDITAYVPISETLTMDETPHEDVSFGLEDNLAVTDTELVTAYIDQTDTVAITEETVEGGRSGGGRGHYSRRPRKSSWSSRGLPGGTSTREVKG